MDNESTPFFMMGVLVGIIAGTMISMISVMCLNQETYEINGAKYLRDRGNYYKMLDSSVEIQLVPMIKEK